MARQLRVGDVVRVKDDGAYWPTRGCWGRIVMMDDRFPEGSPSRGCVAWVVNFRPDESSSEWGDDLELIDTPPSLDREIVEEWLATP